MVKIVTLKPGSCCELRGAVRRRIRYACGYESCPPAHQISVLGFDRKLNRTGSRASRAKWRVESILRYECVISSSTATRLSYRNMAANALEAIRDAGTKVIADTADFDGMRNHTQSIDELLTISNNQISSASVPAKGPQTHHSS